MAAKRNTLCLADKVNVIEYAKQNPSAGTRTIAEVFECGRTQIQTILKKHESITTMKRMLLLLESVHVVHSMKTLIPLCVIGMPWLDRDLCLSLDLCCKRKY